MGYLLLFCSIENAHINACHTRTLLRLGSSLDKNENLLKIAVGRLALFLKIFKEITVVIQEPLIYSY